jgi:soluble lytic murein transglycosylase-like protein
MGRSIYIFATLLGAGLLLRARAARAASRPPPSGPTPAGLRRTFDDVFRRECQGGVPLEYVRTVVKHESDFRPDAATGAARGLMQITPVALRDFNERYGSAVTPSDLLDPTINVRIGCDLLDRIVKSYARNHPRSLATDWTSRRFAELVYLGWNAGYSESGGVGLVVDLLEASGIVGGAVTIDAVHAMAKATPAASRHLRNADKIAYAHKVGAAYVNELGRARSDARA